MLSGAEIDEFVERGFVRVRGAFPRDVADAVRADVWSRIEPDEHDPSTWTSAVVRLNEVLEGWPFSATWTDRVHAAFDQLAGAGRWRQVIRFGQGWWPVSFPGFAEPPWQAPDAGWHVDGQHFHHTLAAPDQVLLPIFLYSDIGPGDGGTALAEGSHEVTARVLAEARPAGLSSKDLDRRMAAEPRPNVVEANGEAGDVVVLHPFMVHAVSSNVGTRVRFITNPCMAGTGPLRIEAPEAPVERAIAAAIASG